MKKYMSLRSIKFAGQTSELKDKIKHLIYTMHISKRIIQIAKKYKIIIAGDLYHLTEMRRE